jgi:uncharacterized protein
MPNGKPAGVVCVNLERATGLCRIWHTEAYPDVCRNFQPAPDACGRNREEALELLAAIETATAPDGGTG